MPLKIPGKKNQFWILPISLLCLVWASVLSWCFVGFGCESKREEKQRPEIKLFIRAEQGAYWSGHFNQLPNRGEAEMVSPQFGLSRWAAGDDVCSCGQQEEGQEQLWGGKVVTRRSETAGSAFCMKGMEQTTSRMTAIHSDQKDGTVSLRGCGESQTDSEGPVGRCFQISWLVRTTGEQRGVLALPPICI